MISFKQVNIKNFRAYEDVSVDFNSETGVVLISGDNNTGKSTFLNAINWCLYGDTPFYTTENIKEVLNNHAPDDAVANVEIFAEIKGKRYKFSRSTKRGSFGGVLDVSVENNGDWEVLDRVIGQEAVRRILPMDLRHLFFFNGERLKDIFSKDSEEHDLKTSVKKVSEIDIIDKAINHLGVVEDSYLRQIGKQNKNSEKINTLRDDVKELESNIEGHADVISEKFDELKSIDKKINELDKLIKDTAESRFIIQKRDELEDRIKNIKIEIGNLEADKLDVFHANFHRAALSKEFHDYCEVLIEASRKGIIPPPIDPVVTQKILKSGTCIVCDRVINDKERKFIENQHAEYERMKELQYLTDGIIVNDQVSHQLVDEFYKYKDIVKSLHEKISEKEKLQEELKAANESLEGIDEAKLHQNPELRRTQLLDRKDRLNMTIGSAARNKDLLESKYKLLKRELEKTISKDSSTQDLDKQRVRAQHLRAQLRIMRDSMEKSIREKLQNSIWKTFSSILPNTNYTEILLDSDYSITLIANDGIKYTSGMISEGTTKVLGLSLAHSLSMNLGYSDVPFLIDNLYGNIKDTHFEAITNMISTLASNKQIIIMDLNIDKTEHSFEKGVIAQKFLIDRLSAENKTIIRELAHEL